MPQYENALQAPPRFQFEANSGTTYASQVYNCGPTCITAIAGFKNDSWYQIETTRRLATGCCDPTTADEQRRMFEARGIPADVLAIETLAELDTLLTNGTRPLVLGIQMIRVPPSVRGHSFLGWHAVAILKRGRNANGVDGYIVMDPNFSPAGSYRPDPTNGRRFYSRQVMYYAVMQNFQQYAIVPRFPKSLPLWAQVGANDPLCTGPYLSKETNPNHGYMELRVLKSVRGGRYEYNYGKSSSTLWARVQRPNGDVQYVPQHRVVIVRHA